MNEKVLKTLEYNKIIDRLTDAASTSIGKELCRNLRPTGDREEIRRYQAETSDGLMRLMQKGSISFSGVRDIRPSVMRLRVGSNLSMSELLAVSGLLDTAARVKSWSRGKDEESTDSLDCYFSILAPLTPLNNEIKRCIISEEEVSDEASTELKHIRRSIRLTNDKVHEQLNSIVNSSSYRTMLQDNLITMRGNRYCLPVKAEYKSQFSGMIHDQSSSGSTLFMEPMAVVKLNNEIQELLLKESAEIERIMALLSGLTAEHADELDENLDSLTQLDFIFAKARLSREMRASEPVFHENGCIRIKKGRHPLIDGKKVVPIDVRLGEEFDLLVITGPNTGGKTVTLKTVGLFTLMGQAGLHIPAFDGSELVVFQEVYADIGDEQSIEQSLSTFSSHMTNTVSILEQADKHSLCLFDELGAGTDPTEGAALAMSILSWLHGKHIFTMATTHYSELKLFALSSDGVENACCEFDVGTLRPTYRLLIGIPGKSNAFAISSKLGLPDYIINDAKNRIDTNDISFEDVISNLQQSRITIEKEQSDIKAYKQEIQELKKMLTLKNEKIDQAKDKILSAAKEEARGILQDAKDYADDSIRKYNKWVQDGTSGKDMEQERNSLRDRLDQANAGLAVKASKASLKNNRPKNFKPGDSVFVLSLNLRGTVCSIPNEKGELFVQMGILRSKVTIHDLEKIADEPTEAKTQSRNGGGSIKMSKAATIHPELNLIGKTVDEALSILDKYLDDAYLSHLPQVTVIHGRGTGALRNAVQSHLKKTNYVKSYRSGEFNEGNQGVTIVEFK